MLTLPDFLTRKVTEVNIDLLDIFGKSGILKSALLFGKDGQEHGIPMEIDVFLNPVFLAGHHPLLTKTATIMGTSPQRLVQAITLSKAGRLPQPLHGPWWKGCVVRRLRVIQPDWYVEVGEALILQPTNTAICKYMASKVETIVAGSSVEDALLVMGHNAIRSFGFVTRFHRKPEGVIFDETERIDRVDGGIGEATAGGIYSMALS